MIQITPTPAQRQQARSSAKKMGVVYNSFTKGAGNAIGMLGELLVHDIVGGDLVGDVCFEHDIVTPKGIKIDVKTTKASGPPLPHYAARVYGSEAKKEKLASKCDVYYFVRCNQQLSVATIVGWLPAREFIERATFLPKGNVDPNDGKLSFADEYTLPISELNPPSVKVTKKACGL